jgi:endonuclease-3
VSEEAAARPRGRRAAPISRGAARAGWAPPASRRVRAIRARLRELYGIPGQPPHEDPLAELVLTVLSQSTNDRNRDVAYLRLRDRLPTWDAVRDADVAIVRAAIQPGGLHVQKSARIKAILHALPADLDLTWMRTADVAGSQAFLCALPGVGRKTAACVLLFAYGLPDVPVDTHVGRVGTRLGLLRPGAGLDPELHDAMLALTPVGAELEFHVNLLRHGRRTCHAQRPACTTCGLRRMCPKVGVA